MVVSKVSVQATTWSNLFDSDGAEIRPGTIDAEAGRGERAISVIAIGGGWFLYLTEEGEIVQLAADGTVSEPFDVGLRRSARLQTSIEWNGDVEDPRRIAFGLDDDFRIIAAPFSVLSDRSIVTVDPGRVLDTRPAGNTVDGQTEATGRLAARGIAEVTIAGRAGVPDDAVGASLNLTAINPPGKGFATLYAIDVVGFSQANDAGVARRKSSRRAAHHARPRRCPGPVSPSLRVGVRHSRANFIRPRCVATAVTRTS